jgi:hypothetical protein
MTRLKTGCFVLVSTFVLALAGVTPALYAHGGDPTLVHACVNKGSGEIKIVGANASCKANETALDWPRTSAALRGVQVVSVPNILVPVGVEVSQTASCPKGKIAVSGGHSVTNLSGIRRVTSTNLVASAPSLDPHTGLPTGWRVTYSANQADNHSLTVYVICASVAP